LSSVAEFTMVEAPTPWGSGPAWRRRLLGGGGGIGRIRGAVGVNIGSENLIYSCCGAAVRGLDEVSMSGKLFWITGGKCS
jgi:hypothetical protein